MNARTVASARRFLDGEHRAVREQVRRILSRKQFAAPVLGMQRDDYREHVLKLTRVLAREGVSAMGFPVEFGGRGDVGASVACFETLGHGDLSVLVKFGVQFGLFGGAVLHLGTREHHDAYLGDIASLKLPGCFAMTESGHGSDVQSIRTTATYDPARHEFVISTPDDDARKDYIGNAACHGRMAVVFAHLVVDGDSRGVHALVVPIRDAKNGVARGVRIEDCGEKLGLNGVDNGRIWFDNVRVPREALLNRYAEVSPDGRYSSLIENPNKRFFTMLGTLIQGRVSVCGASISASKSALTIAVRYALTRRQFSSPGGAETLLLDYRTHQRRLLPALATAYALHFAQEALVAELHRSGLAHDFPDRDRRQLETMAAGLKAVATWHATETIQACREACGGAGYLSVNRIAALKADTDVFTTFEGDNTVLLQLVAKSMLTDYRDQFEDLNPFGMAMFVAEQVLDSIGERSAARELVGRLADDLIPGRDDPSRLFSRDDQLTLFRWREEHIVGGVARRLQSGVKAGGDPFVVFGECQDHVVAAGRAHIDRLVLEAFAAAVDRCKNRGLRRVLEPLCDLYALANIERDRAWFQEHGRLSSTRSKAITRGVNRLCAELRPEAGSLVDAFGIPDVVLGAPIGLTKGV